jgi:hypothetical protein
VADKVVCPIALTLAVNAARLHHPATQYTASPGQKQCWHSRQEQPKAKSWDLYRQTSTHIPDECQQTTVYASINSLRNSERVPRDNCQINDCSPSHLGTTASGSNRLGAQPTTGRPRLAGGLQPHLAFVSWLQAGACSKKPRVRGPVVD